MKKKPQSIISQLLLFTLITLIILFALFVLNIIYNYLNKNLKESMNGADKVDSSTNEARKEFNTSEDADTPLSDIEMNEDEADEVQDSLADDIQNDKN